jgi:uncharacterized C2H2 Zn-finger protein
VGDDVEENMADAGRETMEVGGRRCPRCGAIIHYLDYWRRVINCREYRLDGSYCIMMKIMIDIEESYFLCPECNKMLFDHEEDADKFLRGQLMEEDDICPDY